MTADKLKQIIDNHLLWLKNEGGERANLSDADLRRANLRRANLRCADLRRTDLRRTDLSDANLSDADLRGTDLSDANLSDADLRGTDLSRANLSGTDLSRTDLSRANLSDANLSDADLRGTDLSRADLRRANLSRADLRGTDLSEIRHDIDTAFFALQCPAEGAYIAWKKCRNNALVKLSIPKTAKRSSGTSRKCRASKAVVIEIIGAEEGISINKSDFIYRKGETIIPEQPFDEDRWNECSSGIHHFITREEAEQWNG